MASEGPKKILVKGKEHELSPQLVKLFTEIQKNGAFLSGFALGPRHVFGADYFPGIENWYDAFVSPDQKDSQKQDQKTNSQSEPLGIPKCDIDTFSASTSPSISPSTSPSTSPVTYTFISTQPDISTQPETSSTRRERSGFFKRHFSLKRK